MERTVVLNVVGLTSRLIGPSTPNIREFVQRHRLAHVEPVVPAVTCTAQATYLTGKLPNEHGIVANGWYDRDYAEHRFWKQPNQLVQAPKLWELLRQEDPEFSCAKLFWWFNMHSSVDLSITPRPLYPADGSKVFDVHTQPMAMRERIKKDLGPFPFRHFWGPASDIRSTAWIAEAAKWVEDKHWPSLSLVYLPHLDYHLQRVGIDLEKIETDLQEMDAVVGDLIRFFEHRNVNVVLLSEYGITDVDQPVHLNRVFREKGWLSVKNELGLENLDEGGCEALAIADHQVAHIYVRDPAKVDEVRAVVEQVPGVEQVLGRTEIYYAGLDHPRSGDLIAIADARSWFTYYFWDDDRLAPDYARCVDIHRKCGYDPVELFIDPKIRFPKLKIASKIARKMLGMRMLMDVIPLDAGLVGGSHGRLPEDRADWPVLCGDFPEIPRSGVVAARDVCGQLYGLCARSRGYARVSL